MTVKQIADAWGVSRAIVHRYKAQGMPIQTLQAAEEWRLRNQKASMRRTNFRTVHQKDRPMPPAAQPASPKPASQTPAKTPQGARGRRKAQPIPEPPPPPSVPDPKQEDLKRDDLQGVIARSIKGEILSWALLSQAIKERNFLQIPHLVRGHQQAIESRMTCERRLTEREQALGNLITIDEAWTIIERTLAPLANGLDALPGAICARTNPKNPEIARSVIQDAVNQIKASVNGKKHP